MMKGSPLPTTRGDQGHHVEGQSINHNPEVIRAIMSKGSPYFPRGQCGTHRSLSTAVGRAELRVRPTGSTLRVEPQGRGD